MPFHLLTVALFLFAYLLPFKFAKELIESGVLFTCAPDIMHEEFKEYDVALLGASASSSTPSFSLPAFKAHCSPIHDAPKFI